jgi:hypothetical protein
MAVTLNRLMLGVLIALDGTCLYLQAETSSIEANLTVPSSVRVLRSRMQTHTRLFLHE